MPSATEGEGMESASSKICVATLPKRHSHRLLFDGWVFDEWKVPSEESLAGGREMCCILPLAKAFLKTASQSIDHAANFAVKVFDSPDLLSPQALQTSLSSQLNKFKSSIEKPEFNCFALKKHSLQVPTSPPHLQFETRKTQMD